MNEWTPAIHAESGLPLEFRTAGGTVLPLMVMPRYSKGKQSFSNYLQVAHRLVWFREEHPDWSIVTDLAFEGPDWAVFKAAISTPEGRVIATGHKHEDASGFGDYREKAETGAIGRALALCGYGTQFAPEFDEDERLADSPMPPRKTAAAPEKKQGGAGAQPAARAAGTPPAAAPPAATPEDAHREPATTPEQMKIARARARLIESAARANTTGPGVGEIHLVGELAARCNRQDGIYHVSTFTLAELTRIAGAFDAQAQLAHAGGGS